GNRAATAYGTVRRPASAPHGRSPILEPGRACRRARAQVVVEALVLLGRGVVALAARDAGEVVEDLVVRKQLDARAVALLGAVEVVRHQREVAEPRVHLRPVARAGEARERLAELRARLARAPRLRVEQRELEPRVAALRKQRAVGLERDARRFGPAELR